MTSTSRKISILVVPTIQVFGFCVCEKAMTPHSSTLAWKTSGRRSLEGYSPWGRWGSNTTERLHFHFSLSCTGEGNGNPLQYSCLENLRDGGAWWAAGYGVAQSRTRLKWLSSSSSLVAQSCQTLCYYMHCSLPGSTVDGDSLGKNTGVGCRALLQEFFPTQGPNPDLLRCRWDSLPFEASEKPIWFWCIYLKILQSNNKLFLQLFSHFTLVLLGLPHLKPYEVCVSVFYSILINIVWGTRYFISSITSCLFWFYVNLVSVQFSCSVMSDTLWPRRL